MGFMHQSTCTQFPPSSSCTLRNVVRFLKLTKVWSTSQFSISSLCQLLTKAQEEMWLFYLTLDTFVSSDTMLLLLSPSVSPLTKL